MTVRDFFLKESQKRVGEAVATVEKETAVEVVVTVRKAAGTYRQTDLFVGSLAALGTLVYLLFSEKAFDVWWMPVDVVVAFLVGAGATYEIPPLRRALTAPTLLRESTRTAARAAFYDLGISRTTGRTGILVFVAMFERRVEVVPDVAVKPGELDEDWAKGVAALEAAVRSGPDFDRFLDALVSLRAPLAKALPVQPDDVDELPNEPVMA